jgi:serine/threonine-protein kinase
MSPEQAQGVPLDARSDLYSLGVLMFQMLAGRAPFTDDDAVVVMAKHIKNAPPELEEVAPEVEIPAAVEALVRHALEKLPDNRPRTAEQMLHELEHAVAASRAVESGVRAHVASDDLPESLRLAERRTWVLGGLLAAAIAGVVALGLAVWGRPLKLAAPSSVAGASAALRLNSDPLVEPSVTTASQPITPTLAPSIESGSALENSVADASTSASAPSNSVNEAVLPAIGAASTHALQSTKKAAPKTTKVVPLERRGNERYGRFD